MGQLNVILDFEKQIVELYSHFQMVITWTGYHTQNSFCYFN